MTNTIIYKICTAAEWADAARTGAFTGSAVDIQDGFIHFSTAGQVAETARRHFAGQSDLVLVTVDTGKLNTPLIWEESRGGALFPHLYGVLPVTAAVDVTPLPWNDGVHTFPTGLADAGR
ncbi:MAG: DUF952 domain-containing protein [Alphaproteobacteria bacterium]